MSLLSWAKQTRDAVRGSFSSADYSPNPNGNVIEILKSMSGGSWTATQIEQVIGATDIAGVTAQATGSVVERLAHLQSLVAPQQRLWLPGRFTAPADVTLNTTTLAERINYFRNLTINAGQTVTVANGPALLIVEETLTLGSGAVLSADGKGAKGGTGAASQHGTAGYGGSLHPDVASTESSGFSVGKGVAYFASTSFRNEELIEHCYADGGNPGNVGNAWPGLAGGDNLTYILAGLHSVTNWGGHVQVASWGSPGGGGGGAGAGTNTYAQTGAGGRVGGKGKGSSGSTYSNAPGAGGGGGCGGGGGGGASGGNSGTGGSGGDGGGMVIAICRTLNNGGTIRANATNGTNASGSGAGGGGGGGGGFVGVLYESLTALGTLQANGGTGGSGSGSGTGGASGGAGFAGAAKIRSGS